MRPSVIKQKWAQGQPALATCLHLVDPAVWELTSLLGFDGIWLDIEHRVCSLERAGELIRAARAGGPCDVIARPAKGEFAALARLLEAGATGLMYPRCESPDEAAEAVRWIKFPPAGRRGFDGANPDCDYSLVPPETYLRQANADRFLIVQVEDPDAVALAEAIARIDGVDAIMLGPGDLSLAAGLGGDIFHPVVWEAQHQVAIAAKNAGKRLAATVAGPEHAEKLLELGASLLFHGADIMTVRWGLEAIQNQFRELGFRFGPAATDSAAGQTNGSEGSAAELAAEAASGEGHSYRGRPSHLTDGDGAP